MIRVRERAGGARDSFGNEASPLGEPVDLPGAWAAPGSTADAREDGRPHAVSSSASVYVPKARPEVRWRGARVALDGEAYDWLVVGDPVPYPEGMTPGDYNLVVEVTRDDG